MNTHSATKMAKAINSSTEARTSVPDKRTAILNAATSVFAEKGFFNAKVADIAAAAGIADGTVYLYFKSKDEILHSIFDRAMAEFIDEGRSELEKIGSPERKLSKIAELHLAWLGADRDKAVVFQVELRGSTKFMREFSAAGFSDYLDLIKKTIEEGQEQGLFRNDIKPVVAAKIFYGSLDEMVTNWILSKRSYPLAPMADEVMKIFSGGVMAK
jgi:TetR/AcrR family fatty acid metabolism transcriptional regulator